MRGVCPGQSYLEWTRTRYVDQMRFEIVAAASCVFTDQSVEDIARFASRRGISAASLVNVRYAWVVELLESIPSHEQRAIERLNPRVRDAVLLEKARQYLGLS